MPPNTLGTLPMLPKEQLKEEDTDTSLNDYDNARETAPLVFTILKPTLAI